MTLDVSLGRLYDDFIRLIFLYTHRYDTGNELLEESHQFWSRVTINLERLIVLSESSLLGWFLQVSLIVIIPILSMIHRTKQMTG
jgi:hypothetical protein